MKISTIKEDNLVRASNRPPKSPKRSKKEYIDLLWCNMSLSKRNSSVNKMSSVKYPLFTSGSSDEKSYHVF